MATFIPRLTAPSLTDPRFVNYNRGGISICIVMDEKTGSTLPNCVGYAHGRLLEILGATKVNWKIPACNAEDWYYQARQNGMQVGQTPKLGAVCVWRAGNLKDGSDGAGHVAVIEEIKENGDIVVSQSAYMGTLFYTTEITKASGYMYASNRPLVGFVYCGIEFDNKPTPVNPPAPTPSNEIVAGKAVTLNNTDCYTSETTISPYGKKTGTFYLWDDKVSNERIRITNSPNRVGVSGQVTCWCNVKDLNLTGGITPSVSPAPAPKAPLTNKSYPDYPVGSNKYYKIRKSFKDEKSSKGSYRIWNGAFNIWTTNKAAGYHVYDNEGNQLD